MKRLPAIIALLVLCVLPSVAQLPRIFFVNAYPGSEIYQLEGHSALVVDFGRGGDALAFNYGVFDFNSPNFVYRFVKGETDYMLAAYPFRYFMDEYRHEGRRLVAHELDLDSTQTMRLVKQLMENARPENCTYRYNYVMDNCATRSEPAEADFPQRHAPLPCQLSLVPVRHRHSPRFRHRQDYRPPAHGFRARRA